MTDTAKGHMPLIFRPKLTIQRGFSAIAELLVLFLLHLHYHNVFEHQEMPLYSSHLNNYLGQFLKENYNYSKNL